MNLPNLPIGLSADDRALNEPYWPSGPTLFLCPSCHAGGTCLLAKPPEFRTAQSNRDKASCPSLSASVSSSGAQGSRHGSHHGLHGVLCRTGFSAAPAQSWCSHGPSHTLPSGFPRPVDGFQLPAAFDPQSMVPTQSTDLQIHLGTRKYRIFLLKN